MPIESYELCPSCNHQIVLSKSSTGSFRCPDYQCEFRDNGKTWLVGIPVGLMVVLLLAYLTYGTFIPPILVVFLGIGATTLLFSRIPSCIITKPGGARPAIGEISRSVNGITKPERCRQEAPHPVPLPIEWGAEQGEWPLRFKFVAPVKTMTATCLTFLGFLLLAATASAQSNDASVILTAFDLPAVPDTKLVSQYFNEVGERRFTLSTDSKVLAAPAKHALAWLIRNLHGATATTSRHYTFQRSRTKRGTAHDSEIRRLAAENPALIAPDRYYLHVQYFPHDDLACPEFHAVIDLAGPTIISHWSEGG